MLRFEVRDRRGSATINGNLSCSFCGKSQKEVKKLIAGPTVYICDECIELCNDIIAEEIEKESRQLRPRADPQAGRDQDDPRRVRHRPGAREEDPRGRGPQPLQAHRRQGRRGRRRAAEVEHPAARPHRLGQDAARADAGADPQRPVRHRRRHHAHRGRLRRRGRREHHRQRCCRTPTTTSSRRSAASSTSTRSTRSRARATTRRSPATSPARACSRRCSRSSRAPSRNVPPKGGRKHPQQEFLQVDTTNILFICGGAFVGLEDIIEQPHRPEAASASAPKIQSQEGAHACGSCSREVQPEDLLKFGMIPEFVGRLPVIAPLHELDEDALIDILTKPKNALVKQYQKLFEMDGVKLQFTEGALHGGRRARRSKRKSRRARPARDPRGGDARHHVRGPLASPASRRS